MKTYPFSRDGPVSATSRKGNAMPIRNAVTLLMVGAAIEAVPVDAHTWRRTHGELPSASPADRRGVVVQRIAMLVLLFSVSLMSACDSTSTEPSTFVPGPLGAVSVPAGEAVQIRTLLSVTGAPELAVVARRGAELGVEDLGSVRGRDIELGGALDAMCSPEGGRAGASQITGDEQVVGVVGTICSAAAVAASPIISEAGFLMISPANTSPLLTSDLAGNAQEHRHVGYYRVSNNDLHQGIALSDFAFNRLELRRIVTVHDGDPYTSALAAAFADAFRDVGGEVPATVAVQKGQTDMSSVLAELAPTGLDGIFFPLFLVEGSALAAQARAFDGLEGVTLISGSALLVSEFLGTPQSEGMYFAGPESDYDANVNSVTRQSGAAVLASYEDTYGGPPSAHYWAHAYDATTLLAAAIESAAVEEDGVLHIDRAALRRELERTTIEGLIGDISCDGFGDCGTGRVNIYHHMDSGITDIAELPVLYRYVPATTGPSG